MKFFCRAIVLLVLVSLGATPVCVAKLIISDRTMQDIKDAEAAQKEQITKERTPADGKRWARGTYTDLNGFVFTYGITLPSKVEPGVKYPLFLGNAGSSLAMPSSQVPYPCYTVGCWCPDNLVLKFPDWKSVAASTYKYVIDKIIADYGNIDTDRIYVEGASRFGATSFLSAYYYPDTYAAIVPSVGGVDVSKAKFIASRRIGIWMFAGLKDNLTADAKNRISRTSPGLYKALTDAGYDPMYTEYTYGEHHEYGFTDSLVNPAWNDFTVLRKWLFNQKKPSTEWPIITSPLTAKVFTGKSFKYTITASRSPKIFNAELCIEHEEDEKGIIKSNVPKGLPNGLIFDPNTGIISGTPKEAGRSFIILSAINDKGAGITTLALTVK